MKRIILYVLTVLMLSICQTISAQSEYDRQKQQDLLQVGINIADEAGQPIPYVTVWSTHSKRRADEFTLSAECKPQDMRQCQLQPFLEPHTTKSKFSPAQD